MSHQPERKEKNCLNCGTEVVGRFCHVCGQENVVTHQSFWSLAKHFVYDILHFDGKFFHTLQYIFTRPGFVAKQYAEGKRMSYLDPIRMYLFTSAIFFLIFFSYNKINVNDTSVSGELTNEDRREMAADYEERIRKNPADSGLRKHIPLLLDTSRPLNIDSVGWQGSIRVMGGGDLRTFEEYDSIQKNLPVAERDNGFERFVIKQTIKVNRKYANSGQKAGMILLDGFLHRLPYLLFVSLPFFAFLLKLLYIRRKQFFYSDHAVFTLYHYIFSFMLLLVVTAVYALRKSTDWSAFNYLVGVLILTWPVYLYLEMKRFYLQSHARTAVKFLLLNQAGLFVLLCPFGIFFLFSIFQL